MGYIYLIIAITGEVVATTALKASAGFSNPIPSLVVIIGYAVAFYFLSLVLKTISVGIAYAIWSGLGIVLIAIVGAFFLGQRLDIPAMVGITLIVSGVIVMSVFSNTSTH